MLAFDAAALGDGAKIGILAGSFIAGTIGAIILKTVQRASTS
jgi:Na+/H+ antiporter NhaA